MGLLGPQQSAHRCIDQLNQCEPRNTIWSQL